MPVYKDEKSGNWVARVYVKDPISGRKYQKKKRGFKTKKEATAWESSVIVQNQVSLDITISEFVEVYFEDKRNILKSRSIESKKAIMEKHILDVWKDKKLNDITASDIIWWQNKKIEEGYSTSYLRTIDKELRSLFTHASRVYGLQPNPCSQVTQMGSYESKEFDFWSVEEYELFIGTYDEDDIMHRVMFELLYWTGMRCGEVLALSLEDIDFDAAVINITKTYHRLKGEDLITSPKTKSSKRSVDLPTFLVKELKEYKARLYEYPEDERLFPFVHEAVQHNMKRHIEKAGVKKIRVHDLRHSHVAYLIHEGVDPLLIKRRLGHKDIKITLNTYGHLYPDDQKKVANMLDRKRGKRE